MRALVPGYFECYGVAPSVLSGMPVRYVVRVAFAGDGSANRTERGVAHAMLQGDGHTRRG